RAEHADLRAVQERQRDVRQHLPVGAVELVGAIHREDVLGAHEAPTIASQSRRTVGIVKRLLVVGALFVLAVPASAARLPILASHDWWPVWSPSGNWVAFTRVNGQGTIFSLEVVRASGGRAVQIAQARSQLLPSWSPDSTHLAYQSGGRIHVVSRSGADG